MIDRLPHFTVKLSMDLERRLAQRILEDKMGNYNGQDFGPWEIFGYESEKSIAFQIVRRMYRTQMKEAKAVESFAQAWLDYQQPKINRIEQAMKDLPANRLKMIFGARKEEL